MYNGHFKFREAPFGVTPDPRFYYTNAVYQEASATLRYGIEARKGFIVVTGEAGTGKTTLLRKAMHAFSSNIKTAYLSNSLVGCTDLLHLMLTDLGLAGSTEDRPAMIERFTRYLIEQFEKGNIVALLIDEAQNLTIEMLEELRCLGNLETDKDKLLQIVLVGQPELEQKLDQPELRQLKQRVVLRCRLKPVARDEVKSYMDSRLQIIGHRSENLFDPDAVEKIAFYSTGIPRLINIICDNALLTAYALSARKISAAMIDEVAEDLHLGQSRMEQEVRAEALVNPFEEKGAFESAPAQEDDLTTKEEPLFNDSNDRPLSMQKESIASERATRHWFKPIIGTSAAIALGVFLYSHEWGFSVSGSHSDIAPTLDSGPKKMNRVDLAAAVVEANTSSIIPHPTLPAPQIQPLSLTDQNASRTEKATNVSAAKGIAVARPGSKGPIASEVKKSRRPLRGDPQKTASNSADLHCWKIGRAHV